MYVSCTLSGVLSIVLWKSGSPLCCPYRCSEADICPCMLTIRGIEAFNVRIHGLPNGMNEAYNQL